MIKIRKSVKSLHVKDLIQDYEIERKSFICQSCDQILSNVQMFKYKSGLYTVCKDCSDDCKCEDCSAAKITLNAEEIKYLHKKIIRNQFKKDVKVFVDTYARVLDSKTILKAVDIGIKNNVIKEIIE